MDTMTSNRMVLNDMENSMPSHKRNAPLMVMMENALYDGDIERALIAAKVIAQTSLVPKDYRGKPHEVIVGVEYARQLGIDSPLLALANIANINGRPSLFGDLPLALVQKHPQFVDIEEEQTDTEAMCVIRRMNMLKEVKETATSFSVEDAKRAGLWGKAGPWSNYPKRMLQMRARALCVRDSFADALHGFGVEAANESEAAIEVVVEEPKQSTPIIKVEKHDLDEEPPIMRTKIIAQDSDSEVVDSAGRPVDRVRFRTEPPEFKGDSGMRTVVEPEPQSEEGPRVYKNKTRRPTNPHEGDLWYKGGDMDNAWTFQGGEWTQSFESNREMQRDPDPSPSSGESQLFRCNETDVNTKLDVADDDIWLDTETGNVYSSWRHRWVKIPEEFRIDAIKNRVAELVAAAAKGRGWGKDELIDHCDMTLGTRPDGLLKLTLLDLHQLTMTIPEA